MAARYNLKIVTDFASAHTLRDYPGQCSRMHGHNWKVEVCVAGEKLNEAGVLIDFGELKAHMNDIIGKLDNAHYKLTREASASILI